MRIILASSLPSCLFDFASTIPSCSFPFMSSLNFSCFLLKHFYFTCFCTFFITISKFAFIVWLLFDFYNSLSSSYYSSKQSRSSASYEDTHRDTDNAGSKSSTGNHIHRDLWSFTMSNVHLSTTAEVQLASAAHGSRGHRGSRFQLGYVCFDRSSEAFTDRSVLPKV